MKKFLLTSSVLAALMLSLAGCGKAQPAAAPTDANQTAANQTQTPPATSSPQGNTYTMAQVQAANSASKCWAVIDNNVYDLTRWINQHPGGPDKILGICGTNATAAFRAQHDSQPEPNQTLATFKIGTLK
jgi:cytochrome b involved in lipid metabolism